MRIKCFLIYLTLGMLSLENALSGSSKPSNLASYTQIDKMDFYAQASQDKFVYSILYSLLGKQDKGYYLEIGAGDPIITNNSYFFEKKIFNGKE